MPDTEKPLFRLTPQAKGSFYCLYKWANEEINVYGEMEVEEVSEVGS